MDESDALASLIGQSSQSITAPSPVPAAPAKVLPLIVPLVVLGAVGLWFVIANFALERLFSVSLFGDLLSPAILEGIANLVIFGGIAAIAVGADRVYPPARGSAATRTSTAIVLGLLIGLGGLCYCVLASWMGGHLIPPRASSPRGIIAMAVGTLIILFQSASEELLFRGWLQPAVGQRLGRVGGVLLAALAFAALHILGGARSPLSLLNLFLGGVLFGLLAVRTVGLLAPICAHFGWNWGEQLLFGLDPNPGSSVFGAIFDRDLAGDALWGGSGEGLNASVIVTLTLVALVTALVGTLKPVDGARQPA